MLNVQRVRFVLRNIQSRYLRYSVRAAGLDVDREAIFVGRPVIDLCPGSVITVGAGTRLVSAGRYTALGVTRPVTLRTLAAGAEIAIGDSVGMSGTAICAAQRVSIGRGSMFGSEVLIMDTDFHGLRVDLRGELPEPVAKDAIVVGEDVFVGARAILLKGSKIGNGSVIAAGSVVTGSIPPGVVAAGAPCVVIREL